MVEVEVAHGFPRTIKGIKSKFENLVTFNTCKWRSCRVFFGRRRWCNDCDRHYLHAHENVLRSGAGWMDHLLFKEGS